MAHFAKINKDNIVEQVIVADQEFINSGAVGDPTEWIQTSYNTYKGKHKQGGVPFRKNYAGVGYTYDKDRDAFIPQKTFPSWVLNEETCSWEPPVSKPDIPNRDEKTHILWDEETVSWKIINEE